MGDTLEVSHSLSVSCLLNRNIHQTQVIYQSVDKNVVTRGLHEPNLLLLLDAINSWVFTTLAFTATV